MAVDEGEQKFFFVLVLVLFLLLCLVLFVILALFLLVLFAILVLVCFPRFLSCSVQWSFGTRGPGVFMGIDRGEPSLGSDGSWLKTV